MLSFMEFIQRCKHYCIQFHGASSGDTWLISLFYEAQKKYNKKVDFTVLLNDDFAPYGGEKFELELSQETNMYPYC